MNNPPSRRELMWLAGGSAIGAAAAMASTAIPGWNAIVLRRLLARDPDWLADHPEILASANAALRARALIRQAAQRAALVRTKWSALLHPAFTPTLGNAAAASVLVEFTDYTCAPCRASAGCVDDAIAAHPNLRGAILFVPIGGALAEFAARFALAAYRQQPDRFAGLHRALMMNSQSPTQQDIFDIAATQGLDPARLSDVMHDAEIGHYLEQVHAFAADIDVSGVPSLVIGGHIEIGGITRQQLLKLVDENLAQDAAQADML